MTSLTVSSDALAALAGVSDVVEIRSDSGRLLGYFHPLPSQGVANRASPFSEQTLRQRQGQRSGKPLSEVLAHLSTL